jgi:TatD-related deoxyribonuclease
MSWDGPLFDNHMHIDPRNGRGLDAVRDFPRAGGTHLMLVGKPARDWGIDARDVPSFLLTYERTLGCRDINEESRSRLCGWVSPSEMTGIEACGVGMPRAGFGSGCVGAAL